MRARWRHQAECATHPRWADYRQHIQLKICHDCPVAEACFWAALVEESAAPFSEVGPSGIRGATKPGQRIKARELGTVDQLFAHYCVVTETYAAAAHVQHYG
jgi:hypothetical protein